MSHDLSLPSPASSAIGMPVRLGTQGCAEVSDRVIARLVRHRLASLKRQGWAAFGLFGGALTMLATGALLGPSEILLGVAGAGIATLAMGLGFCVDRLAWWRFLREARHYGLSEEGARTLFVRATSAEELIEVMMSCGAEPTDAELARFVR